MSQEVWKDVVGYEGYYEVSNTGLVRSLDRRVRCGKGFGTKKGRMLKGHNHEGYTRYVLCVDQVSSPRLAHRVVAEAFIGTCPNGKYLVCHKDDNPKNNTPSNLYWGNDADNQADRIRNDKLPTYRTGTNHHMSKTTEQDARYIRSLYCSGFSIRDIQGLYYPQLTWESVKNIASNKTWRHV